MEVLAHSGEKLGTVRDVWAYLPEYGYVQASRFVLSDYGPIRGTAHLLEGADGYVQVAQRRGIRRENESDLYIPLGAVRDVVPGLALVVGHHNEECHATFSERPARLGGRS